MIIFRFFLFFLIISSTAFAQSRQSSFLIEFETGKVLQSENATLSRYPASLTKMMTLYMTFDALEKKEITMDQLLPVSLKASKMPKSRMGLKAGSQISVENVIFSLISRSANDAAVVIAEALGGTESQFAEKMTTVARDLGMKDTTFKNASGLHNKDQVSTARDMAILSSAIIKHFPQYYKMFSIRGFRFGKRYYGNHNLVARFYRGGDGLKTGYVDASGYHVVGSAVRNNKRLIGVIMGRNSVRERDRHIFRLLDYGFNLLKNEQSETPIQLSGLVFENQIEKPRNEEEYRKTKILAHKISEHTNSIVSILDSLNMEKMDKLTKNAIVEWK